MEYKITLPIYYMVNKKDQILIGMNWFRNAHFQVSNKAKKFYTELIREDLEGEPQLKGELHAHYDIYIKRRGTDGGNVRSVVEKFALDGFKKAGIIPEDHFEIIRSDSSEYHHDPDYPRAVVTITEKEKDNGPQIKIDF